MSQLVRRQGDKQDGDMGDGAMVSDTLEPTDAWLLDGNGQEPAEHALDGRASVVVFLECIGAIWDLVADAVGDTPEVVASLLRGELRMADGAKEQIGFVSPVIEWA